MKIEYNEAALSSTVFTLYVTYVSTSVVNLMMYVSHINIQAKISNIFALSMELRRNIFVGEHKMLLDYGKGDQIHKNKDKSKKNTIRKTAIICANSTNSLSTTSDASDLSSGGSVEAVDNTRSNLHSTISEQDDTSRIDLTLTHPTQSKRLNLVCNCAYLDGLSSNNVHREAAITNFHGIHIDLSIVTCCRRGELVTGCVSDHDDHDSTTLKVIQDNHLLNGTINSHRYLSRKQSNNYSIACSLLLQSSKRSSCSAIYNTVLSSKFSTLNTNLNNTLDQSIAKQLKQMQTTCNAVIGFV